MHFQLSRIDEIRNDGAGSKQLVLIDERTGPQAKISRWRSVLFAAARVGVAAQYARENAPGSIIVYQCKQRPPPFIVEVVHAAGGQVAVGPFDYIAPMGKRRQVDAIVDEAFAHLAKESAGRKKPRVALETASAAVRRKAPSKAENELKYWTAMFDLASLAGECLRPLGGGWVREDGVASLLGFTFQIGDAKVNCLSKAHKFLEDPRNGGDDLEPMVDHLMKTLTGKRKRKTASAAPAKMQAVGPRFTPVPDEKGTFADVRSWRCPNHLLFSIPGEAYLALGLGRAWALFGRPGNVGYCEFRYVLRDAQSKGVFVTFGINPGYDLVFGGRGPAKALAASIDALEQAINSATPVDCDLTIEGDGHDTHLGYRKGKPFVE